jgi:TetR/AcrR family transcriptional repressor of nem operon
VAKPREFDYDKVVNAARDLFWERGYVSTSLAQLLAVTGLSKSTLYQTFGTKRALFAVAVENYLAEVMSPLISPMEAEGAGRAELIGYFNGLAEMIRMSPQDKARRGCFMLNTFMELEDLDDAARVVSADYRSRVCDAIHHIVVTMTDTVRDPMGTAEVLTAAKMGLMVTSRVDPARAIMLAETIAADIANWAPLPR